jgi:hypothetical protein
MVIDQHVQCGQEGVQLFAHTLILDALLPCPCHRASSHDLHGINHLGCRAVARRPAMVGRQAVAGQGRASVRAGRAAPLPGGRARWSGRAQERTPRRDEGRPVLGHGSVAVGGRTTTPADQSTALVGTGQVRRSGERAVLGSQHHLHQTGNARGRLHVADVGLQGTDEQRTRPGRTVRGDQRRRPRSRRRR